MSTVPFCKPLRRPHICQSRIVTAPDGFYRGALDVIEPASWADCAMVHDDRGEAWGTVAWLHDQPGEWWLGQYPFYPEKGQPPIMGAAEIVFATDMGADLLLVETPEAYVTRAWCGPWDGPTACILDWARPDAVRLWLSLVRAVRCETPELSRAVETLLAAVPRRQRLRIETVEAAKPPAKAECERVDLDRGTKLEPFPLRERVAVRADANHAGAAP